ncbi:hypothetical protein ACVIYL_004778 [Bradyrhizobium sp. USDA 3315]
MRKLVRNLLSNVASTSFVSDDVIKLFLEWIRDCSELHFAVIGTIYNDAEITLAGISAETWSCASAGGFSRRQSVSADHSRFEYGPDRTATSRERLRAPLHRQATPRCMLQEARKWQRRRVEGWRSSGRSEKTVRGKAPTHALPRASEPPRRSSRICSISGSKLE